MRFSGQLLENVRVKYSENGLAGVCRSVLRRFAPIREVGNVNKRDGTVFSSVLEWLAGIDAFSIVQIGAYVGDTGNDPLFKFLRQELGPAKRMRRTGSSVILVEPVKQYYDLLQKNYEGCDVKFENVAIAESSGSRDLYRIDVQPAAHNLPEWLSQLSSLRADRMTTLWDGHERTRELKEFYLANRIVERVSCITFHELADRHSLQAIDLLQIDAEGYDYEIIRSIDFAKLTPRVINYERVLLGENELRCRKLLNSAGYILIDWGDDTLAIHLR
jgi:FkbM family methyltransferase